ncbi:MAG: DUF3277 family protein [Propionibacteriaceae bacterium]|nr:DUF3277 family protein [Propionibacteriaceae bacterium]
MKTYDPNLIHVTFAGHFIEGFGDGTFVTFAKTTPGFSKKTGVKGEVTRTRMHDRSGEVTITLMATSKSNDRLSELYNSDRNSANGEGVGSLTIQDIGGAALFTAAKAWIQNSPDPSFEAEVGTREWVIAYEKLDETHGGNDDA